MPKNEYERVICTSYFHITKHLNYFYYSIIISDRHIIESFINYLFHALCECSENVFVLKYILHVQFG